MKRIGDYPMRKVSFDAPAIVAPEQEGGIQQCFCQPCPFGGTIQSQDKWWRCRFHDGRPKWAEKIVSEVLADNDTLAREIQRGFNIIASHLRSDAFYQTVMIDAMTRCEASRPGRYEFDVSLADEAPSKLWVADFKKFVFAMNKQLTGLIGEAVKSHKEFA